MASINIGECEFLHTESIRSGGPLMICKCGKNAESIVSRRNPVHCLERAAQAVLRPKFIDAHEVFKAAHPQEQRRMNDPTAAAPLSVHQAWADAGGVTLKEYFKSKGRLGKQPERPAEVPLREKAEAVLSEIGVAVNPSQPGPAPIPVTVVGDDSASASTTTTTAADVMGDAT